MSRKIIGVTVGTPMKPQAIAEEIKVPTKVSELDNDSNYLTESMLDRKLMGYMEYEGTQGDPPANSLLLVADGTNYLVPYLDEYYQLKRYNLPLVTEDGPGAMSPEDKSKLDNLSIPTKVSQLENDSKFLTSIPSEYVTETELTTKGYAKQSEVNNLFEEIEDLKALLVDGNGVEY